MGPNLDHILLGTCHDKSRKMEYVFILVYEKETGNDDKVEQITYFYLPVNVRSAMVFHIIILLTCEYLHQMRYSKG